VEQGMLATRGPKCDKTRAEKNKVESTSKRCVEDKWCMERRFIAHDKVDYVMIQICLLVFIAYENNIQKRTNQIAQQKSNQQTNIQGNQPTDQPGQQNRIFLRITKKWDVGIFF
jgi:hypothetical protein